MSDISFIDEGTAEMKVFYDSAVRAGFTEEQAMDMLCVSLFATAGGKMETNWRLRDVVRFSKKLWRAKL